MNEGAQARLTPFQLQVAELFFRQPASRFFLLAGGGAMLAHGFGSRPTQDLDFFTRPGGNEIRLVRDQFVAAAEAKGWSVQSIRDTETFCRMVVRSQEDLLMDLALDSAPGRPATMTVAGPTFAPEETAGRKVIALFDRAAARDFADVFVLSRFYSRADLLRFAVEVDAGFELPVFVEMLGQITRYRDVDLNFAGVDVGELRDFVGSWIAELRAQAVSPRDRRT